MKFAFKTIQQFNDCFKDEKTCYEFLEQQRWGGVPVCPHCGSEKYYKVKSRTIFVDIPSYRCANRPCDLPFSVRTGSIYEGSKIELRKWFQAIYELSTSKKGISSVELAVRIGTSQKTAWLMNHKIRTMLGDIDNPNNEKMGEGGQVVEVDETYIGGKVPNMVKSKRKKHAKGEINSQTNKMVVMGYIVRGGELKLKSIVSRVEIISSVLETIAPDAVMISDTSGFYKGVGNKFAAHLTVDHSKDEYVNGSIHTNTIEGAFSLLDRCITGIYHFVSKKHIQRYLDEVSTRYNNRKKTNIDLLYQMLNGSSTPRITYAQLTK